VVMARFGGSVSYDTGWLRTFKCGLDLIDERPCIEVSGRYDGEVVRCIPALKKVETPGMVQGGHALHAPKNGSSVGVNPIGFSKGEFRENMPRSVICPSNLLKDDILFAPNFIGVKEGMPDCVGEYIHSNREGLSGERGVVHRHIEGRIGVDSTPGALHFSRDLSDPTPFGALEKHVLVEMGQAFFARAFIGGPHTGPDLEVGHRGESGLSEQYGEAVVELLVVDFVRGQWNSRG